MTIPKMCLKLSFSDFKWDLQAILSPTVLSNCVSVSSNFDKVFFPDCTRFCMKNGLGIRVSQTEINQNGDLKWLGFNMAAVSIVSQEKPLF